jgi:hypothetical protein
MLTIDTGVPQAIMSFCVHKLYVNMSGIYKCIIAAGDSVYYKFDIDLVK